MGLPNEGSRIALGLRNLGWKRAPVLRLFGLKIIGSAR